MYVWAIINDFELVMNVILDRYKFGNEFPTGLSNERMDSVVLIFV